MRKGEIERISKKASERIGERFGMCVVLDVFRDEKVKRRDEMHRRLRLWKYILVRFGESCSRSNIVVRVRGQKKRAMIVACKRKNIARSVAQIFAELVVLYKKTIPPV